MNDLDAARGLVRESGGDELLDRLDHLDRTWQEGKRRKVPATGPQGVAAHPEFDVAMAGGGLWLLLAPLLAARGMRVVVIDRGRAGVAHREWNASGPELRALVSAGILTDAELEKMVVARYRSGLCRFHRGGVYPVAGVLDHAVDAAALLSHARRRAEALGVTFVDRHAIVDEFEGRHGVLLRLRGANGEHEELTASLLVDARGASSPYASADLVCPTVGGVLRGLAPGTAPDEVDEGVGEILVTVDAAESGRQHVWEGFPGRAGELTVYLFHYASAFEPVSLVALYARFFRTRATYKRGDGKLLRPTFGFIPGWSRLTPPPAAPGRRVFLVGDAAARHSPLTMCGFGATLRSLSRAADAIEGALSSRLGPPACIVDDAPIHAFTGPLARMMASRQLGGNELNELLDAAFAVLHSMAGDAYAKLLRDEMGEQTFMAFLRSTAKRHPAVWRKARRGLGISSLARWGVKLAGGLARGAA